MNDSGSRFSDAFLRAFVVLMILEGEFVDDPDDPGGKTKYGISQAAYPHLNILRLTADQARQIYWEDYWAFHDLDRLHSEVATEVFEATVNTSGPRQRKSKGVELLQRAINFLEGGGLTEDGLLGPITVGRANHWSDTNHPALLKAQNGEQYRYYRRVVQAQKSHKFAAGWMRRIVF